VGCGIKKILRSRLPERLAGKVPPLLVELAIGIAIPLVFVAVRTALVPLLGDRAPYAFNFLAVVSAAVLAGWRGGLVALAVGQTATWFAIVAGETSLPERVGGLVIATIAELLTLCVIALYQREVAKAWAEREKRLALLDEALREIDHRTRNNYQTVLAMVELQARRSANEDVSAALLQVADRIQAIANASKQLAVQSAELGVVRLDDHLCGLVQQIERGLSRGEILVKCEVDDVTASVDKATSISIIVNELVTNAIKHAFNGESFGHVWVTGKSGTVFELVVADDGRGIKAPRRNGHDGLGTKLVESFARQLGAAHDVVSSDKGTTHRLVIPDLR
jgi:two-component system, sensor histidine kinase PdtaS